MSTDELINIAAHLPTMAEQQPDDLAVVVQDAHGSNTVYHQYTFKELDEESNRIANGLERIGITRGMRTVLMVTPGLDFFALTFALFKVGAVPVMVDPGMGVKNLKTCLAEAEPEAFIGIPKAHVARVLLGWGKATNRINVTAGRRVFWGGTTLHALAHGSDAQYAMVETHADEVAAILFTSGSTGVPKGAIYTHGIFDAQVGSLRDDYGIVPGERDLATFPLFALFGPALGMAAIMPDMDASKPAQANPRHIIAAIEKFEATNMFGSPALIDVVGRYGAKNDIELPTLKRVISAGAPARAASIGRFATMLAEDVEVFPSYGATEALPVARIGSTELLRDTEQLTALGAGVCVGYPVKGIAVAIIKISDEPIEDWTPDLIAPKGEIGEIVVRGRVVTHAYYNRPASTALSKIVDKDTGGHCHRMGDVGYFDDEGRLWMCGRKTHRVETCDETLFTIPCERIFDEHPAVLRTALVGVGVSGAAKPVLCVELSDHASRNEGQLRQELRALAEANPKTRNIETFLFHPAFPVDIRHNAKIFREKLAVWAEETLK